MGPVDLERFKLEGLLGSGSDYEVHAATDGETGKPVVIKRPNPDYITRKMHLGVDQLSEHLIEVHQSMGESQPYMTHMVGYTEVALHDDYFGETLKESYRVLVEERAVGIPMVCDIRDKFKGVPIGLGQNLFAIHPLVSHPDGGRFAVHQQLMELEEAFHEKGHFLLDMRPQNLYFEPWEGRIQVIDIGTIPAQGKASQGKVSFGNQPRDLHDFYAEMFKYYATPQGPPSDAAGYKESLGMRHIRFFDEQLESLAQSFSKASGTQAEDAAVTVLQKIRSRAYQSFGDFRREFVEYLALVEERNRDLPDLDSLVQVWRQAMDMLTQDYWRKFLFEPERDLARYRAI